jgi:hypothetical protein
MPDKLIVDDIQKGYELVWSLPRGSVKTQALETMRRVEAEQNVSELWELDPETGKYKLTKLVFLGGKSFGGA